MSDARWRVGNNVPINVYEGDRPICQCHTALDAKRIVDAVNRTLDEPNPSPFSKGYKHREGQPVSDACGEGRHADCTQDLTKCHCTFRHGHRVPHAYMDMAMGKVLLGRRDV